MSKKLAPATLTVALLLVSSNFARVPHRVSRKMEEQLTRRNAFLLEI